MVILQLRVAGPNTPMSSFLLYQICQFPLNTQASLCKISNLIYQQAQEMTWSHVLPNDVLVNNEPNVQQWSP